MQELNKRTEFLFIRQRMKLRRHRNIKPISNRSEEITDNTLIDDRTVGYTAANICVDSTKIAVGNNTAMTSDSDISDSENAKGKNLTSLQAKIRLAALNLMSIIIRVCIDFENDLMCISTSCLYLFGFFLIDYGKACYIRILVVFASGW